MSRRLPVLTLRGWLLAILLPAVGVLIVAYAALLYALLEREITAGFDGKLSGVSTTVAAFIDPADHQHLIGPLPIGSMTHDSSTSTIWALDVSRHVLLKIRPTDGVAEDTGIRVPPEIDNLSNDLKPGFFLLVDNQSGHFLRLELATGRITPALDVTPPISAIATGIRRHMLYVAGRDLRRVDLLTGKVSRVSDLPEPIRDLTYDRMRDCLWGLNERGNGILELSADTGAVRRRVPLAFASQDDADAAGSRQGVDLRTLAFERIGGTLLGSASSLLRIDPDKGTVSAQGFLASFGQEQGPVYRRYAAPMTRIMARANLTYLYTQIVQGRDHIVYGLDGTQGKDHSPLLSTDTVREAEVSGVQRLMTEGSYYVSDVEVWPPWGLLKSSFAPIFNDLGRPIAMAGADVNVGVIQFQTRRALVFTFGFGALILIAAGLMTFLIAQRLTGPLGAIKNGALRAAAGDFSQKIEVTRPRELRLLSRRISEASTELGRQIDAYTKGFAERRRNHDRDGLAEALERLPGLTSDGSGALNWGARGAGAAAAAPSGVVRTDAGSIAWIARPVDDPLEALARRAEFAALAEAALARHGSDPAALGSLLAGAFPSEILGWALAEPGGMRVLEARR